MYKLLYFCEALDFCEAVVYAEWERGANNDGQRKTLCQQYPPGSGGGSCAAASGGLAASADHQTERARGLDLSSYRASGAAGGAASVQQA